MRLVDSSNVFSAHNVLIYVYGCFTLPYKLELMTGLDKILCESDTNQKN